MQYYVSENDNFIIKCGLVCITVVVCVFFCYIQDSEINESVVNKMNSLTDVSVSHLHIFDLFKYAVKYNSFNFKIVLDIQNR